MAIKCLPSATYRPDKEHYRFIVDKKEKKKKPKTNN